MKLDLFGKLLSVKCGVILCISLTSCSNYSIVLRNLNPDTMTKAILATDSKIEVRVPPKMFDIDVTKMRAYVTNKKIKNAITSEIKPLSVSRRIIRPGRMNWVIDISPNDFKRGNYYISFFSSNEKLYEIPVSLKSEVVTPFNM